MAAAAESVGLFYVGKRLPGFVGVVAQGIILCIIAGGESAGSEFDGKIAKRSGLAGVIFGGLDRIESLTVGDHENDIFGLGRPGSVCGNENYHAKYCGEKPIVFEIHELGHCLIFPFLKL